MAAKSCCPTVLKPVASGYTPLGLSFYIIKSRVAGSTKGIVIVTDIFGNHPNAYQFADMLAGHGFTVAIPDYFRGTPWPTDKWPADFESAEWQAFYKRITTLGDFVNDVEQAVEILKGLGCTSIGCVGFCWGAKVALTALAQSKVSAVAGPHPSFLDVKDVTDAKGPIALLMSKDEGPFLDVKEILETNPFKSKNVFQRYDDLYHGFLGARGPLERAFDFSGLEKNEVDKRCAEASLVVVDFFKNTL